MVSGVYWEKGDNPANEDSLALEEVCTNRGDCVLLTVCDGVGSLDFGEIASGYATECMIRWFYECGMWMAYSGRRIVRRSLGRTAFDCHMKLRKEAGINNIKWATTCTMVCIWKRKYVCMQIGDSSCYRIGKNRIRRIGKKARNGRGELVSCLGRGEFKKPCLSFGYLKKKDFLLLATDGFADSFDEEEIKNLICMDGEISRDRIEKRLRNIGEEAGRRGATDNRSALLLQI